MVHLPLHPPQPRPCSATHLKWVVLGCDLDCEELVQDGDLLHDVVADLGDLGEEEEGEEAGYAAEATGEDTAALD